MEPSQRSAKPDDPPLEKLLTLSAGNALAEPVLEKPAAIVSQTPASKRASRAREQREQRERAEAQRARADAKWLESHRAKQKARGAGVAPARIWPRDVEVMRCDILSDPSGKAVLAHAARLRRSHSGVPIWAIVRAALGPRDDGQYLRTWVSERARRIAVLGFAMLMLCKPTSRRSQWRHIVRGFSVGSWEALLRSPFEKRQPARSTLTGRARRSVGYLRALEDAGFMYRQQLPANEVAEWELGNDRDGRKRSFNRYWLVGLTTTCNLETQLRLHAWHEAGWAAADSAPKASAPRERAQPP